MTIIKNWKASGHSNDVMDQEQEDEMGDKWLTRAWWGWRRTTRPFCDDDALESNLGEIVEDNNDESSSMAAPTFGRLMQRPARVLDSRAAFLNGMPLYILYYWEVVESQPLLSTCLQRLSNHANVSDTSSAALVLRRGGTASVRSSVTSSGESSRSGSRKRNTDKTDDDERSITTENWLVPSLQDLVDSQQSLLSDRARDREHSGAREYL